MVTSVWKSKMFAVWSKSYHVITSWNNENCLIKACWMEASISSLEEHCATLGSSDLAFL